MAIARVFPRRTKMTPDDDMAFCRMPTLEDFGRPIEAVHVSVTWTYDLPKAERLAKAWGCLGVPVLIGGPATGQRGEEFTPGMYLCEGPVITSRGCPNRHCWFCSVWRREGDVRELPIRDGWNVLDDNLLACSESHIREAFAMLKRQKHQAEFTGGLEAARLQRWHVDLLADLRPAQLFMAYDTPDDLEPLIAAGRMFDEAGLRYTRTGKQSHRLRCYVLIGYPKDAFDAAEQRLRQTMAAGFFPMAMFYRNAKGERDPAWATFQREWANATILGSKANERQA